MGCNSSKAAEPKTEQPDTQAQPQDEPVTAVPLSVEQTAIEQTPEERALTQLKLIFDSIDADSDGTIIKAEFEDALAKNPNLGGLIKEAGLNPGYKVLDQLDTNADGRVSWEEFSVHLKQAAEEEVKQKGDVAAVDMPADEKAIQQLEVVFNGVDSDADGTVSKDELVSALQNDSSLVDLIQRAGFNSDSCSLEQFTPKKEGRITWDEFKEHLRAAAKEEIKAIGEVAAAAPPVVIEGEEKSKSVCC